MIVDLTQGSEVQKPVIPMISHKSNEIALLKKRFYANHTCLLILAMTMFQTTLLRTKLKATWKKKSQTNKHTNSTMFGNKYAIKAVRLNVAVLGIFIKDRQVEMFLLFNAIRNHKS